MDKDRDNAANFVEYMCSEGASFSYTSKKLGTLVAVLFYLRKFEKWLQGREKEQAEAVQTSHNSDYKSILSRIRKVVYGRGDSTTMVLKIKDILTYLNPSDFS